MELKKETTVLYSVKARIQDRPEIIRIINSTLDGYTVKYHMASFFLDYVWVYIFILKNNEVLVHFRDKPVAKVEPDVDFLVYTDISSIPLMHAAILAGKLSRS